jgi:hypothetical protein
MELKQLGKLIKTLQNDQLLHHGGELDLGNLVEIYLLGLVRAIQMVGMVQ